MTVPRTFAWTVRGGHLSGEFIVGGASVWTAQGGAGGEQHPEGLIRGHSTMPARVHSLLLISM